MNRMVLAVFCAWAVTATSRGVVAADAQAPVAEQRPTIWDGIYTIEQAARGQERYDVYCAHCHGTDMQGQEPDVPALADEAFASKWDGRSVHELFDLITVSMPETRPGSLALEVYADLLAYILQASGFPGGPWELRHDAAALRGIVFERSQFGPQR